MDVTIIAALAAGSFAATQALAQRIGEVEFNALYHQGNGSHIFMNSVDDDTIMITVFGKETTVGLVRFYSTSASASLAALMRATARKTGQTSRRSGSTPSDIAASAMSERHGKPARSPRHLHDLIPARGRRPTRRKSRRVYPRRTSVPDPGCRGTPPPDGRSGMFRVAGFWLSW